MTSSQNSSGLRPGLVLLMSFATGATVASNYYAQPLLHTISQRLSLSYSSAGFILTLAQLAYAVGLVLLVPLGDRFDRRKLIVSMSFVCAAGLVVCAVAPGIGWLLAGTALTALFSVVAQILVPFAASLAAEHERGKVVGTVMSGLLLGILLGRTFAGLLSSVGGWRAVYACAAVLMAITATLLARSLPHGKSTSSLSYFGLLRTTATLFAEEPVFRLRSLLGALTFAVFAIMWTSIAFLLSAPPFGFSDALIGLFGLAGAAGALAAAQVGKLADHGKSRLSTWIGLILILVSWLPLVLGAHSVAWLVLGIILLDLGAQAVHVTNQSVIYRLRPEARSRLTSGYMTAYFIGGALGSLLSAGAFSQAGWFGVCLVGALITMAACALWAVARGHEAATAAAAPRS